jgi:Bacterial Ig-like domain (group 3)
MGDAFNVTAAYDKAIYNKGDPMTVTISGGDVLTAISQTQSGTLTLTLTAADGSTTSIAVQPVTINVTTTTPESVKITGAVDSTGRPWTIAADGLTVSGTA